MLNLLHLGTEPTRPEAVVSFEDLPGYFILQLPVDNLISMTDLVQDAVHYVEMYGPNWLLTIPKPDIESALRYAIYTAAPSWLHVEPFGGKEFVDCFAWFLISLEK